MKLINSQTADAIITEIIHTYPSTTFNFRCPKCNQAGSVIVSYPHTRAEPRHSPFSPGYNTTDSLNYSYNYNNQYSIELVCPKCRTEFIISPNIQLLYNRSLNIKCVCETPLFFDLRDYYNMGNDLNICYY
jgi:hypothetical protein